MGEASEMTAKTTLFLTDNDVAELADTDAIIAALVAAYSQPENPAETPERVVVPTAGGWQRVMVSAPGSSKLAGSKTISASLKNGLVSYLVSLFDTQDSHLVALIDGNRLTGLRTAGTSAAALTKLAPSVSVVTAVIGSGFEARAQLKAAARVLSISEVRVSSPTAANRERFASELSAELGIKVTAVDSAEAAVKSADLIICAARSRDETPVVMADWVSPNATIVSVGSTTPSQIELDPVLVGTAKIVVADALLEVLHDSGDMLAAKAAGFSTELNTVSLHELMAGTAIRSADGIAIYKSSGSGFQDIVVAEHLYNRAMELGIGTVLPVGILTLKK